MAPVVLYHLLYSLLSPTLTLSYCHYALFLTLCFATRNPLVLFLFCPPPFPYFMFPIILFLHGNRFYSLFFTSILILLLLLNPTPLFNLSPNPTYLIFQERVIPLFLFTQLFSIFFYHLYCFTTHLKHPFSFLMLSTFTASATADPPTAASLLKSSTPLSERHIFLLSLFVPMVPPAIGGLAFLLKSHFALSYLNLYYYLFLSFLLLLLPLLPLLRLPPLTPQPYSKKHVFIGMALLMLLLFTNLSILPFINTFLLFFSTKDTTPTTKRIIVYLSSIPPLAYLIQNIPLPLSIMLHRNEITLLLLNFFFGLALGPLPTALLTLTFFPELQAHHIPVLFVLSYLSFITPPVWELVVICPKTKKLAIYTCISAFSLSFLWLKLF